MADNFEAVGPMLREGIAAAISRQANMEMVGEAVNGRGAVDAVRTAREDHRADDEQGGCTSAAALKAGASGYLLKSALRKV